MNSESDVPPPRFEEYLGLRKSTALEEYEAAMGSGMGENVEGMGKGRAWLKEHLVIYSK